MSVEFFHGGSLPHPSSTKLSNKKSIQMKQVTEQTNNNTLRNKGSVSLKWIFLETNVIPCVFTLQPEGWGSQRQNDYEPLIVTIKKNYNGIIKNWKIDLGSEEFEFVPSHMNWW